MVHSRDVRGGGVVLSIGTITIDRATEYELVPRWITGGPDAALGILTTIAVSMVSLATLVLTITMVVVQLAMGQFSPRIVQTFLRDRPSQFAIGLFVATFVHTMSMREVQFDGDGQVPGMAIGVAYVLVPSWGSFVPAGARRRRGTFPVRVTVS